MKYHDEARFSPHEATKTANEAKNVDDHFQLVLEIVVMKLRWSKLVPAATN
jgi:hypothetical protein